MKAIHPSRYSRLRLWPNYSFPKSFRLALVALFVASLGAQTAPPATRIQLFLIERPVGFETATTVSTAEGRTVTSEMELVDRGTRLQLSASLSVAPDGTARHFRASGKSYRFVNVDAEIQFPISPRPKIGFWP